MSSLNIHHQRGDGEGIFVALMICFVLFAGEPDVWDGLQAWAKWAVKYYAITEQKK